MKILVPVKRVLDPYAKVKPLNDGTGLDLAGLKFDINPFDEIAVEAAVQLKEADSNIQIIVVSIGSAECEDQLRKALAMGADEAILIETNEQIDSPIVAAELALVIQETNPDLVIMGKQATDDDNNQAGQMLAAKLDWPQASFAAKIELEAAQIHVTRETDTGEETLILPLPALITTDLRLNEPRYIALPGIIKARQKPLTKTARKTTMEPLTKVIAYSAPPARSAGKKVASVEELIAEIQAKGVLS